MCQRCKRDNRVLRAGGACKTRRVKLQEVGSKKTGDFLGFSLLCQLYRAFEPKGLVLVIVRGNNVAGTEQGFQAAGTCSGHGSILVFYAALIVGTASSRARV